MRGKRLSTLTGIAAAAGMFVAAGSASGAVIGAQNLTNSDGAATCLSATCTVADPRIPGETAKAPFSGKITRWRVSIPDAHDAFNNDGPVRLQVLKRTVDKAGLANDEYVAVRESDSEDAVPGLINPFQTNLRIRKGQFIGLASTNDTEIHQRDKARAHFLNWIDALIPGDPARTPDIADRGRYSLFNAKLVK
jgi:hypothetical protein